MEWAEFNVYERAIPKDDITAIIFFLFRFIAFFFSLVTDVIKIFSEVQYFKQNICLSKNKKFFYIYNPLAERREGK